MKWGTGDDHSALLDYQSHLNHWFTIQNVAPDRQHDYIIFQAGEKGEKQSKIWNLSDNELKEPKNVWNAMTQLVATQKRDSQKKKENSYSKYEKMPVTDCSFCGKDLDHGRCPAYNSTCGYCKKKGHWKDCCLKLKGQNFVKKETS